MYHFIFNLLLVLPSPKTCYVFIIVSRIHICKLLPSACPQLSVICQVNMTPRNMIKIAVRL